VRPSKPATKIFALVRIAVTIALAFTTALVFVRGFTGGKPTLYQRASHLLGYVYPCPLDAPADLPWPAASAACHDIFCFGHKNSLFGHNRFSTLFFLMKVAESEKIVLASCTIDFKDIQV
jgi:hypothetical protein